MFLGAMVEMFLRLAFGVVFVTSGWSKLRGGIPAWIALGLLESAVGLAVLSGFGLRLAIGALIFLLVVFTAYIYQAWRKQTQKSCKCGGVLGDALLGKAILLRNGILMAAALGLLALVTGGGNALGVDKVAGFGAGATPSTPISVAGTSAGLVLGGVALALYLRLRPREAEAVPGVHG